MQRNINKSISSESKHITVTGFRGDNKDTPAKKIKEGKSKLKAAKNNVSAAKHDFEDAFDLKVKAFKEDASEKISQTEIKILELKDKITNTSKEIGIIYQDNIDILEHSKKLLAKRLGEYKDLGAEDWKSFKQQFNEEIENFEASVANFLQQLKSKEESDDKTTK